MNPLYRTDTYLDKIESKIATVTLTAEGATAICCRDLVLFPGGGGQCPDAGWLHIRGQAYPVRELVKRSGDVLIALHERIACHDELTKGEEIGQEVDMRRRLHAARLHSDQHALGAAARLTVPGYETRGMNIQIENGEGSCEMRFGTYLAVTASMVEEMIGMLSVAVSMNLPIRVETNESVEAVRAKYGEAFRIDRSLPDYKGNRLRTIVIGDMHSPLMDVSLCAGTHLRSLSEGQDIEIVDYHTDPDTAECRLRFRLRNQF